MKPSGEICKPARLIATPVGRSGAAGGIPEVSMETAVITTLDRAQTALSGTAQGGA